MDTITSFAELGLSSTMIQALKDKGFDSPSAIQALVIPEYLKEQSNIIGQAQTGTGKTAAFSIPIIETLVQEDGVTKALILTPTRELANQVSDEIYTLISGKKLRVLPVYGGQSLDLQIKNLKRGVDIVVGTPGRVIDLIERRALNLSELQFFVLDEADEMLNMGFIDAIEDILKKTKEDKSMLFFSATMPDSILKIAKKYMKTFKILKVASREETTSLTEQIYFEVRDFEKFETLCRVLDFERDFYGIIFVRTKHEADDVTRHLKSRGYDAEAIHGDVSQAVRNKTLADFKLKKCNILIATDVAARGIDVNNLTHVINYSIPNEAESYVHRIGRTGRAGNKGIAITFVTPREAYQLTRIQRMTKTNIKRQSAPSVQEVLLAKKESLEACVNKIIVENDHTDYLELAKQISTDNSVDVVVAALLRHVYNDEFLPQNYKPLERPKSSYSADEQRGSRSNNNRRDNDSRDRGNFRDNLRDNLGEDQTKLFVALGKKDGMNPKKMLDFLHEKVKTPARKVKDIRILDAFSFITVPFEEAETILRGINAGGSDKRPLITRAKR